MLPSSLLLLVVKVTIVLVVALGVTTALRRAPAGVRHLVWLATLGALLVVPAVAAWSPLRVALLPAALATPAAQPDVAAPRATADTRADAVADANVAAQATADAGADASTDARTAPVADGAAAATGANAPSPSASPALRLAIEAGRGMLGVVPALLAIWAAVALAIGFVLLGAWSAARRIVRRAEPLESPDWLEPLWEISDRFGLAEPPRLVRSADVKMPFACGLAKPTIVLPAESDDWSLDRRRAVLLHELAHVRRHDLVGHTLARVVCAVWWFHPLAWTAARKLRAESEHACDDLALVCGARPADYAEHLLDIVTSVRQDRTPLVAMAMARRAEFEGRMLAILDPERPRAARRRWHSLAAVGAFAMVAVLVGAVTPVAAEATAATASTASMMTAAHDEEMQDAGTRTRLPAAAPLLDTPEARVLKPRTPAPESLGGSAGDVAKDVADKVAAPVVRAVVPQVLDAVIGRDPAIAEEVRKEKELERLLGEAAVKGDKGAKGAKEIAAEQASDSERVALLAKVLRTDADPSLRRIAAWGLAEYADEPAAATALVAAVRSDANAGVREMAAWALAEARRTPENREALVAALKDREVRVRQTAAWALGALEDRMAVDALVAALSDADREVRLRAIWAIGATEPRQAPPRLIEGLRDRDPKVRKLTAWSLYVIEDPAAVPALQAALKGETDKELQLSYIRALASLGEKSVEALKELLDSNDPQVKAMAVRALAGGEVAGPWPMPWPEPRPTP